MKNLLIYILTSGVFNFTVGQNSKSDLLKGYDYYVEKNLEMGKWWNKYYLKKGIAVIEENYWKKELRHRTAFEFDNQNNVKQEIETYNINDGKVNNILNIKLKYEDSLLIRKEFDFGMTEKYSDFNEFGKPKLIERFEESEFKAFPFKEVLEYDKNGNVTKSTEYSIYEDLNGKVVNEKATTSYKYDKWNNVIEIHREFEPRQKFPIIMTGGPAKYEFEYFRYKYNKKGLWTEKFKTVNGKEFLVAKRKYK